MSVIRRYVAIIQDPRGYPAEGLEPTPPDGPAPPLLFSVIKVDDHDAAMRGAVEVRGAATDLLRVLDRFDNAPVSAMDAIERLRTALGGE